MGLDVGPALGSTLGLTLMGAELIAFSSAPVLVMVAVLTFSLKLELPCTLGAELIAFSSAPVLLLVPVLKLSLKLELS